MTEIKLSLCITTYDRFDYLVTNVPKYLKNDFIHEIVISDDCSSDYEKLIKEFKDENRVKIYKTDKNCGPFLNKINALKLATNDWICLMDSDNYAGSNYFDAFFNYIKKNGLYPAYIYAPARADPYFNYTALNNHTYNYKNWNNTYLSQPTNTFLNTGNYILHKSIINFVGNLTNKPLVDVLYFNKIAVENGYNIVCVPDMYYDHTVHSGSFVMNNSDPFFKELESYDWKLSLKNEQIKILELFKNFKPNATYPIYPPYTSTYLEDYYYDYFVKHLPNLSRLYIPVFWTTCYLQNQIGGLQELLNSLDRNLKYYTVSQHDDAVKEVLPPDTLVLSAGGNGGNIPIPLICSPIPEKYIKNSSEVKKDIFCSFVGSNTHRIRDKMISTLSHLSNNKDYYIKSSGWSGSVSEQNLKHFIDITERSIFTLCPRGYGRTSFRLYEAMQLNSIPVYVSDIHWLPFSDVINWDDFSVVISEKDIGNIDSILKGISEEERNKKNDNLKKYWTKYFALDQLPVNIQRIVNKE